MSQEHVQLVRRACVAWKDGDLSTYYDMYAPDVDASGGLLWPDAQGSAKDADEIIRNFESVRAAFKRSELIPQGFIEAGEKLVVVLLWRGLLPDSDAPVEQHLVSAYEFRDDLIARQAWFATLGEALDALELPASAAENLVASENMPLG